VHPVESSAWAGAKDSLVTRKAIRWSTAGSLGLDARSEARSPARRSTVRARIPARAHTLASTRMCDDRRSFLGEKF
jgi:hypothetical protein